MVFSVLVLRKGKKRKDALRLRKGRQRYGENWRKKQLERLMLRRKRGKISSNNVRDDFTKTSKKPMRKKRKGEELLRRSLNPRKRCTSLNPKGLQKPWTISEMICYLQDHRFNLWMGFTSWMECSRKQQLNILKKVFAYF